MNLISVEGRTEEVDGISPRGVRQRGRREKKGRRESTHPSRPVLFISPKNKKTGGIGNPKARGKGGGEGVISKSNSQLSAPGIRKGSKGKHLPKRKGDAGEEGICR